MSSWSIESSHPGLILNTDTVPAWDLCALSHVMAKSGWKPPRSGLFFLGFIPFEGLGISWRLDWINFHWRNQPEETVKHMPMSGEQITTPEG